MTQLSQEPWAVTDERHPVGRFVSPRTVRYERTFPVPVERLWQAVSTPEDMGTWLMPTGADTELEPRVGGRIRFDGICQGIVVDVDPGARIVAAFDDGGGVALTVHGAPGGAALEFTHWLPADMTLPQDGTEWHDQPGGPGTYQVALGACWHGSLVNLDVLLGAEQAPLADGAERSWHPMFAAYRAAFIEAFPQHGTASAPPGGRPDPSVRLRTSIDGNVSEVWRLVADPKRWLAEEASLDLAAGTLSLAGGPIWSGTQDLHEAVPGHLLRFGWSFPANSPEWAEGETEVEIRIETTPGESAGRVQVVVEHGARVPQAVVGGGMTSFWTAALAELKAAVELGTWPDFLDLTPWREADRKDNVAPPSALIRRAQVPPCDLRDLARELRYDLGERIIDLDADRLELRGGADRHHPWSTATTATWSLDDGCLTLEVIGDEIGSTSAMFWAVEHRLLSLQAIARRSFRAVTT
jgi:uncharacterized protein YndB with AHSA1/START domain